MGLRAGFTMTQLGYPSETSTLGLHIDYSKGCNTFIDTFLQVSKALCPVDTGFLRSSINATKVGDGVECWAGADYAQYLEFGTFKMEAQPYFIPGLTAAFAAATPEWAQAFMEAQALELTKIMENSHQSIQVEIT